MQDTDLYRLILGNCLAWQVEDVKLDVAGVRVDVFPNHERGLNGLAMNVGRS